MTAKERMLLKVQGGAMSCQDLNQLRENIQGRADVDKLHDAIELQLRTRCPKTANAVYGRKDHDARERLQVVLQELESKYNLSGNEQGQGVKTGGDQRTGAKYICQYISYRNQARNVVQLTIEQDAADSEMYASVQRYIAFSGAARETERFALENWERACQTYETELAKLLP